MMILISVLRERRRETFLLPISQGQHELTRKAMHANHLADYSIQTAPSL